MTGIAVGETALTVTFDQFDLDSYTLFLRAKALPESEITYDWERDAYTLTAPARFAPLLGAQAPTAVRERLPLADHLFDYQRWVVEKALRDKRMAAWLDCVAGDTIIDGPDGSGRIDELAAAGKPIRVWSLAPDGTRVAAWATSPFKKGTAELFRFTLDDGSSITVTRRHRFLTPDGWRRAGDLAAGDDLAVYAPSPPVSSSEPDRLGLPQGVPCSMQTPEGSMGHCATCCRQCGQLLRSVVDIVQEQSPLRDDVHAFGQPCPHGDGRAHISTRSHHRPDSDRLSMMDSERLGCCAAHGGQYHASPSRSQLTVWNSQAPWRCERDASPAPSIHGWPRYAGQVSRCGQRSDFAVSHVAASSDAQGIRSNRGAVQSPQTARPRLPMFEYPRSGAQDKRVVTQAFGDVSFRSIVSVHYTGTADYYDLHVPGYENYLANGVWNHNTGLGKTIVFTEWARQVVALTGGRVLIFTPLAVIPQVIEEAHRFYGDRLQIERLDSREALADWCKLPGTGIGITNHHKMVDGVLPELRWLAGVVLDEASVLKAGGGKIKWNLIHSCKGIEYKLSCTATPAPNEVMEYASQASWLEKLRDGDDILWTYFHKTKAGDWQVKPHARAAFYQFMSSWSVYMRDPARFGFQDILASLPAPAIREYEVPLTDQQRELAMGYRARAGKGFFDDRLGVAERSKLSQLAKGFLYDNRQGVWHLTARVDSNKPRMVADLVRADVADGRQVLVWTVFDEEGAILLEEMRDCGFAVGVLDGGMSDAARLEVLARFRRGELRALFSKASLIGYGMNLQFVRSMVFSGFDDSFERMYQATRRAVRFGQTEVVRVHVPYVPELEGMVFSNVRAKEAAFLRDVALQEEQYRKVMMGEAA